MTKPGVMPNMALAQRLFREIHDCSDDGTGVTRDAYGEGEQRAHDIVRSHGASLGLETRIDHVGNLYVTLPGKDRGARRIVIGSHLDSVPAGGDYDGVAGVVAGIAVIAGMRDAQYVPRRDITVMAIRAEEAGAWFPVSYPGSFAALGRLPVEALDVRRRDSGLSLREHMARMGFDPDACERGEPGLEPDEIEAFIEVHIEQGPVLESEGLPIGIVTGIPGWARRRHGCIVGEYNHAGATPRRYRRDAAVALAELIHRVDQSWERMDAAGRVLVCTFCVMGTTAEASFSKVPGETMFELDVRSVDQDAIDGLDAEIRRIAADISARRGVRIDLGPLEERSPHSTDISLRHAIGTAADRVNVAYRELASGGGHDTAAFLAAGVPAAMLFVRNQNGSHNPDEAMRLEDFEKACSVLMEWAIHA